MTFVSDYEISHTPDQLIIRGRRQNVIVAASLACILVPFSLAIACQNIVGTAEVPAIWTRPAGDQIFSFAAILLTLAFGAIPVCLYVVFTRKRRRAWIFNRSSAELTHLDQLWPLADLTTVAVDVRRGKGFFRGATPESAAVLLHFGELQTVELARFHAGNQKGHPPLERCIHWSTDLANIIAHFLDVPVQLPPRANQGFEVLPKSVS